jgi:hypothetical protein
MARRQAVAERNERPPDLKVGNVVDVTGNLVKVMRIATGEEEVRRNSARRACSVRCGETLYHGESADDCCKKSRPEVARLPSCLPRTAPVMMID